MLFKDHTTSSHSDAKQSGDDHGGKIQQQPGNCPNRSCHNKRKELDDEKKTCHDDDDDDDDVESSNEGIHFKRLKMSYQQFCENEKRKGDPVKSPTTTEASCFLKERNSEERKHDGSETILPQPFLPAMEKSSDDMLPEPVALDPLLVPLKCAPNRRIDCDDLSGILDLEDEVGLKADEASFSHVQGKGDPDDAINHHDYLFSTVGHNPTQYPEDYSYENDLTSYDHPFNINALRLKPRIPHEHLSGGNHLHHQQQQQRQQQQNVFLVHPLSLHPIGDANSESDELDEETGSD